MRHLFKRWASNHQLSSATNETDFSRITMHHRQAPIIEEDDEVDDDDDDDNDGEGAFTVHRVHFVVGEIV
jgi:hypothetical protein